MTTQLDCKKLLRLLEDHHVKYMIVGGYAVAHHGFPGVTNVVEASQAS